MSRKSTVASHQDTARQETDEMSDNLVATELDSDQRQMKT